MNRSDVVTRVSNVSQTTTLKRDDPCYRQSADVNLYLGDNVQPRPVGNIYNGYVRKSINAHTRTMEDVNISPCYARSQAFAGARNAVTIGGNATNENPVEEQ